MDSNPEALTGLHHIGISVQDVNRSVAFWSAFLGVQSKWRRRLDGPYLGDLTGYQGIEIEAAFIELPNGTLLEILEYQTEAKVPNPETTANPGNVHICLGTDDIAAVWERAIRAGARPVSPGPVAITTGPNEGTVACYLRDPDGITIELFQLPTPEEPTGCWSPR